MFKFTETALRDGHQSLIATRMTTEEILPAVEIMDQVGYHAMEVWGGATFDVCLRYLNENPWERLREIRKRAKNTKLQMLLRGQNLLGYKHYPNDIVDRFICKSIENGIDIIRVFDALNDTRNLKKSFEVIAREGGHCQGAISYTTSQVHTLDYYLKLAKEMEQMGADSICIKDMAGILTPQNASLLISNLKKTVAIPLELHSHCTSGIADLTYAKAIEAGIDIIDTAVSAFSGGTSQPTTEVYNSIYEDSLGKHALNKDALVEAAEYLNSVKRKHIEQGNFNRRVMDVNPRILDYQVPGGMLSNLMAQLDQQGMADRYEEVLKEIPKVRADLGYPPLVTPLSQMVGTQAVFNVMTGEPYKISPKEIKLYVQGYYGRPPAEIQNEIRQTIIGDRPVIDQCPADLLDDGYTEVKKAVAELTDDEEMILAYAIFPENTKTYLEAQESQKEKASIEYDLEMVFG
ncbi:oxaloacetate decarboxylase subunit alpha [Gottschalkiaceae bacterium SANA]|nr:oxaloacetate decarboxylase subunit alpha [Gottschalkiaceae bacterium SANA]